MAPTTVAVFHDALAAGDAQAVRTVCAPDVLVHSPEPGRGRAALDEAASRLFAEPEDVGLPDPVFVLNDDDLVATCYSMPQRRADGPTGDFFWIDVVRVAEGRIIEWWPSVNDAAPTQITASARPGLSAGPIGDTDPERMKALAVAFYREVFDSEDADAVGRFVTEDYRQHSGHLPPGREGLEGLARMLFPNGARPMPEPMTLQPKVLVAQGDIVVHGVELLQVASTGRETYPYIVYDAYRVRDGKITEHWSGINPAAPPLHAPPDPPV